ncbi:DNA gyrase inhibitor YacG [Ideonella oryzae]|uniref:DNA gyrase inhibitor YacG n=1 Tax=Ideonella oryzae TaxID=2937441 RepID=A0ABT1BMU1_9BURK|nr:DNA gyrase inhibitor YacG [Ideonella oryzae]
MNPPTTATPRAPINVTCPSCGERTVFGPTNPYRPFCSARCQGHDFGAWASENYRVAANGGAEPSEETPE